MTINSRTILLIEDNPDDARLLQYMLSEIKGAMRNVIWVERLADGLKRLTEGGIDVVLLDLSLPDSQGLETLGKVRSQAAEAPIVILTGLDDEMVAVKAMQAGAQDYLVKGQVDSNLLGRVMRYAIERQQLLQKLEDARRQEQQERELYSLEQLSDPFPTNITAQLYGSVPLRQSQSNTFTELVEEYEKLMELALEQRLYRVTYSVSAELQTVAERLGFLKVRPRDVIEIHTTALKAKCFGATSVKAQAYVEEGRLMVLELMGYLVSYYRNYSLSVRGISAPATTEEKPRQAGIKEENHE